jgi:membrane associated rhomboid family serine protease
VIPIHDNVPTRSFPLVTVALIATNAAVWLFYQVPNLDRSVFELGFYPCEVNSSCGEHGEPWPVNAVTAMFLHGSWLHIIGNMVFLWIFGNNVEDAMGRLRFLLFYFLAGFAATAAQGWITLAFGSAQEADIPNVGASGAIAGVLGAYLVLFPAARVIALFPLGFILIPLEVPALFFLGIWFLFQLWQGGFSLVAPDGASGGVAFFAHIGGFVFGLVAVHIFATRRRPGIAGLW